MAPPPNLEALLTCERYENIDPDEWVVIQQWLHVYGATYDQIACNVRLGPGRPTEPGDSEATQSMWKAATQVRADLIAWRGADVDVIEAKVYARVDAVTQVKRYVRLFLEQTRDVGRVRPIVICRHAEIAVDVALHCAGGLVERFPAPTLVVG